MTPPIGLLVFDIDEKSFFFYHSIANGWQNIIGSLELPYIDVVDGVPTAMSITNTQNSPTATSGEYVSSHGIGVKASGFKKGIMVSGQEIGGEFFGETGIDVEGGDIAGNFYGGNGSIGVKIDMNGNHLNALIVDRGRAGIGTTSPNAKLHVRDANATNGITTGESIFKASAYQPSIPDEMNLEYWIAQPQGGQPNEPYFGMRSNHRLNLVSNNNTSNPEISMLDNKVGINKKDGTYPLSINGKTAIYENNMYVGEIFGNETSGDLHINAKIDQEFYGKNVILQSAGMGIPGKVGIITNNPNANFHVGSRNSQNIPVAILGNSIFDDGINNSTKIRGNNGLYLNDNNNAFVKIASNGGDVIISNNSINSNNTSKVIIAQAGDIELVNGGGNVKMPHLNSKLSIGTSNTTHQLNVNGTIRSTEVIVESGWADYVFGDDYQLSPLHVVEKFIECNGHLPNVPTAAEIKENGLKLSEMQTKMMEKIEELTLYIIDQEKRIDKLSKEINQLKNK
jgi:hypothetical protein